MLLAGCAAWFPGEYTTTDHLGFLAEALATDARGRETLWRSMEGAGSSDDARLRVALLQSLPDHSGYDPAAARARLDALAARNPASPEVAAIARLRLAQMGETAECRNEANELRQRLARVVDIERRLNKDK